VSQLRGACVAHSAVAVENSRHTLSLGGHGLEALKAWEHQVGGDGCGCLFLTTVHALVAILRLAGLGAAVAVAVAVSVRQLAFCSAPTDVLSALVAVLQNIPCYFRLY
jgi:hypothetical protein